MISEPHKIDFPAVDSKAKQALLVISDHLDWTTAEGEHLLMLQEKLNTYLHFVESGKFVAHMPATAGIPITIRIRGKYPLSPEATRFFVLAKSRIEELGFSLEFQHAPWPRRRASRV